MEKQIANLKRQNEGMETSFTNKGILFTKFNNHNVDPETELKLLTDHNEYLKDLAKKHRPPPEAPKHKAVALKLVDPQDDYGEPLVIKPVKMYPIITNMEDIKRAFFSKDYETATHLMKQHPFSFYKANYKYAGDNTGRPAYMAKNLLRGFVQGLDEYRTYLMVCFRCMLSNVETNEYHYPSYWVVNTTEDLKTILGAMYDDFEFTAVEGDEEVKRMLKTMEKNEYECDDEFIGEVYLH